MTATIAVEGVTKSFRQTAVPVVDRLDLHVGAGEFVALRGPSGCGKTTLLRMMDGLSTPDSGTIRIGAQRVTRPTPSVGFVFQADSLWPWRSVLHNVTFGLEIQGRKRDEAERIAVELLDLVGLRGYERYHPHELSGGMRQRVNLARSRSIPTSYCSTSRLPRSTRRRARSCSSSSCGSGKRAAKRSSSSRIRSTRRSSFPIESSL